MGKGMDPKQYEHQIEDLDGNPQDFSAEDEDFVFDDESSDEGTSPEQETEEANEGKEKENDQEGDQEGDQESENDQAGEQPRMVRDPEVDNLREEIAALKRERAEEQHKESNEKLEGDISDAQQKLRDAIESGDTDAQIEQQNNLVDLRVRKSMAGSQQQQPQQQPQQQRQPPSRPPALDRWLARNQWFQQNMESKDALRAREIDAELQQQGSDPSSEEHYEKVDAKLREQTKPKRKSAGPARTNGMGAQSRSGKVVLDANDRRAMQDYGLDPQNKEHAKAWAQEKRANP